MLLAKKDEVDIPLNYEENDFLLADASEIKEFEDLNDIVCMMAQIQQANNDSKNGPIYDFDFVSDVSDPPMSFINEIYPKIDHEKRYHEQQEIIKPTIDDDQINGDIIFDDPNAETMRLEIAKQQKFSQEVKQSNALLTKEIEKYKERILEFESKYANKTNFQKEYLEAIQREKKLDHQLQTHLFNDKERIKAIQKEKDELPTDNSLKLKMIVLL
nr:hypothetical protein [Tanacetum cinerariifolium]